MVEMGGTVAMSCSFAMRRVAISVGCAAVSTFVRGGGGMAKGRTGMGRMGKSW
jgi:hypothetical protein